MAAPARYQLYYWPFIQGRGELPRLVLEAAGVAYSDVARLSEDEGGGVPALLAFLRSEKPGMLPFAPPFLVDGDLVIAQSANICRYLGERHGLAPGDEPGRAHALQLALTVCDLIDEAHNTHHPISGSLYYEDQKAEAAAYAQKFCGERIPKYLGYFESVLAASGGPWLLGSALSYADLFAFQMVAGLEYAFPRTSVRCIGDAPMLAELHRCITVVPAIAAYLSSPRRIPFNEMGIFRHYPELDRPA